ncbi:hypothetical protein BDR06DRAFT_977600 [Suillus hirtellus]|nr:hypothetical protein BDR06DRAFT_977600 [Suillus hirtellus]
MARGTVLPLAMAKLPINPLQTHPWDKTLWTLKERTWHLTRHKRRSFDKSRQRTSTANTRGLVFKTQNYCDIIKRLKFQVVAVRHQKEMRLVFPNSHWINRGNYVIKEPADACHANDVTDLIILHEHPLPHGPTAYFTLHNVALRHNIGSYKSSTVSEQYPHLIFEEFTSKVGGWVRDVLKFLFSVPKEDSKRVMMFSNYGDSISCRLEFLACEIRQVTIEQTETE